MPRSEDPIQQQPSPPASAGFRSFALDSRVLRGLDAADFREPRPIQGQAIPAVLSGRDVLGLAQTGTGKTAAFALPILSRFAASGNPSGASPRALVLAPTRELATQIGAEVDLLGKFTNLRTAVLYGGTPISRQVRALGRRPDLVVACPGRLLDLHQKREIDLRGVEILVLDEADHMFDMGFLPDIRRILRSLPRRRQNLLFSATMPREIRRLTEEVLSNPRVIELAHSAPAETIDHALYPCSHGAKPELLAHLLGQEDFTSAIVFLRTKSRAKRLAERLVRDGRRAVALQGNMNQSQRDRAMRGFREGRYDVLVATDIAARGLDVRGVSHVINFDVPGTPDAYTHRIGRTGRSKRQGKACTFVTPEDRAQVKGIEKRIGSAIPRVHLPGFGGPEKDARSRQRGKAAGSGGARARTSQAETNRSEPGRPESATARRDAWKEGKGWSRPMGDPLFEDGARGSRADSGRFSGRESGRQAGRRAAKRIRHAERRDGRGGAKAERTSGPWDGWSQGKPRKSGSSAKTGATRSGHSGRGVERDTGGATAGGQKRGRRGSRSGSPYGNGGGARSTGSTGGRRRKPHSRDRTGF